MLAYIFSLHFYFINRFRTQQKPSNSDVLAANSNGKTVILCNHSNTERPYFQSLSSKLEKLFDGNIKMIVSEVDKDPLMFV